ncbi:MAG: hypothetical protein QGH12_01350, partial [SAR324 cluster bacterium]|nr:hypothetical protein [SAR324 cluster bacterium]
MPILRGLSVLFVVAIFLVGCDSGKKVEEESAYSSTSTDTTALALAETTAIQCVTTDPTPQYIFSSTKPGTVSYSGSCSGDRSYAFAGNNTISLYSGSGSSGLFIPLSNGAYKDCKVTVTDAGGTAQELAITSFGVSDPNSQSGGMASDLATSLGCSTSSGSSRMSGPGRAQALRRGFAFSAPSRTIQRTAEANAAEITASQARSISMAVVETLQQNNLLDSCDLNQSIPIIVKGAQAKLPDLNLGGTEKTVKVVQSIVSGLVKSLKNRDMSSTECGSSGRSLGRVDVAAAKVSAVGSITKASVSNLRATGMDTKAAAGAAQSVAATAVSNLGETGVDAATIGSAMESITQNAVSGLSEIEGMDVNRVQSAIAGIAEEATKSIQNIKIAGSAPENITSVVGNLASGLTKALGSLQKVEGFTADSLPAVTGLITKSVAKELEKVSTDVAAISAMMADVTGSVT